MKTIIVLIGSENSIEVQAKAFSGYLEENISQTENIEAWVLASGAVDENRIQLPISVGNIQLVEMPAINVPNNYLDVISDLITTVKPLQILFANDSISIGLAVTAASRFGGSCGTGVLRTTWEKPNLQIEKMVYAGNMKGNFHLKKAPFCLSIGAGFYGKTGCILNRIKIKKQKASSERQQGWLINSKRVSDHSTDDNLVDAKRVIVIGRGITSKTKLPKLNQLATLLESSLGASRPVVMNGWVGLDKLIGVSGKVISPEFCLTIGVSGAAAFSYGIKKSKCLISINNDPMAPIFSISHQGVCSDWEKIADALIKKLQYKASK